MQNNNLSKKMVLAPKFSKMVSHFMAEITKKFSQKLDKLLLVGLKDKELSYLIHQEGFNELMVFILLVKDRWKSMMEIIKKGRVKGVYFHILIMDYQLNKILSKFCKIKFTEQT